MSAQVDLIETAKRALKARGLTYRDVARTLELSEASVKRMFSRRDFTLERLERVCALADLSIADLVRMAESERPEVSELSLQQERELVADDKLLLLAVQVVNGWRFEELIDVFAFTEPELIGHLVKLDRLGIIELLPRNRIRLRISRRFRWQKNGPIERSLARQVREDFLESRFDLSDESMGFVFGMLSARSTAIMQRRIEQLVREFNELHQEDLQLPRAECEGRTMLLAMRSWEPGAFTALRRG